jgi:hypothetical protein
VKMDRRSRKYASWIVEGADQAMSMDVTFDDSTWHPLAIVGVVTVETEETGISVTGLKVQCLLRGPEAEDWTDAILLPLGTNRAKLRVTDSPEIEIQNAGTIVVA